MPRYHYTKNCIVDSLRSLEISKGDVVFSHISLLELGLCQSDVVDTFISAMKEVIGEEGSFLTPSYSYSFCNGKDFDPLTTKSEVGAFSNALISRHKMARSIDPLFSLVGFGPHTAELFKALPPSSFGEDCVYERLLKANAKVCNIGISFFCFTPIHYLERTLNVPYRFDKVFSGTCILENERIPIEWDYYVRHLNECCVADCSLLHNESLKRGITSQASLGLGQVYAAPLAQLYKLAENLIKQDQWCLVQGNSESFIAHNENPKNG
ncbi:AAC(3) family N-acetyltransferase [Marinomonas sp. 2405UD68-3]|uniref:AAC(3) family N-acetyltransferase n=1 Tax=Marinomonas sp. 2405UD68-3 TaxID=3391835 RepID=UPI0039C9365D